MFCIAGKKFVRYVCAAGDAATAALRAPSMPAAATVKTIRTRPSTDLLQRFSIGQTIKAVQTALWSP
jgi:hypothetical protein